MVRCPPAAVLVRLCAAALVPPSSLSPAMCCSGLLPLLLPLVLLFAATGVAGAVGLNEVLVNAPGGPAGITQFNPQVASYEGNILVVWSDFTSPSVGRLNYGYSTDGGNTFLDQDIPPCASGWRWSSDPVLRVDPVTGVFMLVAHIARLGPGNTPGIGFARGTFSGGRFTWERESAITDLGGVYGFFYVASITVGMRQSTDEYLVLYTTSPNPSKELRLVSSRNGGITWGTPVTLAKNGPHYGLALQEMNDGTMLAIYREGTATKVQRAPSGSSTYSPITIYTAPVERTGPPGIIGGLGMIPSIAVARDDAPVPGLAYICWAESFDYMNDVLPPLYGTWNYRPEIEPNDDPASSLEMVPGQILVGSTGYASDVDYFRFYLTAGEKFLSEADSLPAGPLLITQIVSPDQVHVLNGVFSQAGLPERLAFVAPIDGWYYLRISSYPVAIPGYRIRTMLADGTGDRGRDVRDIFVSTSEDGQSWSEPVMVNSDIVGMDDYMPTIAVGFDGAAYVTWYDYNDDPSGALSRLVVAQSVDGGRSWSAPFYVSSVADDWNSSGDPGFQNGMFAEPTALRMTWTDNRNGTSDVYYAHLITDFAVPGCPADTAGNPSTTITTNVSVLALNQFFDQAVTWSMECENRAWPMTSGSFGVRAHSLALIPVTINVPDTANVGTVTMLLRLRQGANLHTCEFNLSIQSVVGVEDGPIAFAFERVTPNPAPGRASLAFALPQAGLVRLTIFGLDGRRVRELANGAMPAGRHRLEWDGRDAGGARARPGAYFVRLEAGEFRATRKFVVM